LNNKHKATPPRSTATLSKEEEKNKIHTLKLQKTKRSDSNSCRDGYQKVASGGKQKRVRLTS
jgi:hypothetical protein